VFSSRLPRAFDENALRRALVARRAAGLPLVDLTVSNPTAVGFSYRDDLLAPLASPAGLSYEPDAAGLEPAREAVAREFDRRGTPVPADRIILTASTSEAYSYLFKLLCEPGDEVLVPQPSYPLFEWLTRLESVQARPYRLEYHGRWTIDTQSLAAAVTPRTKALLIVSPNNPTGSYLTIGEVEAIASIAPGVPIIGDEVFWDFPLPDAPRERVSIVQHGGRLVFSLGGLSKSAALPQLKLGWIAMGGDAAVVAEAREKLELIADTFLSVSTPVQLSAEALVDSGARMREQIQARTMRNLAALRSVVAERPDLNLLKAEGGWSAVVRVPATRTEEELAVALLEEDGVLVHPGYFFDFEHEAFVVVSLIAPPGDFDRGVAAIASRFAGRP
jgi:aspartate/methionine/tyrosine aminotransferase